jgi:hypothetical protein
LPGLAHAAHIKYVSSKAVVEGIQASATAACPSGSHLIGGGGAITGGWSGDVDAPSLSFIAPRDGVDTGEIADDAFVAEMRNDGGVARNLRATAACLRDSEGGGALAYERADGGFFGTTGNFESYSPCPVGEVIGGGFEASSDVFSVRLNASHPAGFGSPWDAWRVRVEPTTGSGAGIPYSVHAICTGAADLRLTRVAQIAGIERTPTTKVKVACPGKHQVASGGVRGPEEAAILSSAPYDGKDRDRKPDDGWLGEGATYDDDPHGIRVHAVCLRT